MNMMIKVTVVTQKQTEVSLPAGACVCDLLAAAGLTEDIGVIAIAGKAVRREHVLYDGDVVRVFPEIIGG